MPTQGGRIWVPVFSWPISTEMYVRIAAATLLLSACTNPAAQPCGGFLNGSGVMESPNYPDFYVGKLNCNWSLQASRDDGTIFLQFDAFTASQWNEYCTLYVAGILAYNWRRPIEPNIMENITIGSSATIICNSGVNFITTGFKIRFSTIYVPGCGGNINGSGEIVLSEFSGTNAHICTWKIEASPVNGNVVLQFESFSSDQYDSQIEAWCENEKTPFYGLTRLTRPINITCGRRSAIIFKTRGAFLVRRLEILVKTTVPGCGGIINGSGELLSPHYPFNYTTYTFCQWNIVAWPVNGNILLQFEAFSTQVVDYLEVFLSDSSYYRFSGSASPSNLTLGQSATAIFKSLNSVTDRGFRITMKTIANACGGTLTGSGTLEHPGNSDKDMGALTCTWALQASPLDGNVFVQFPVADPASCCFSCYIYIGGNTYAIPCGTNVTTGSQATVRCSLRCSNVTHGIRILFNTTVAKPSCGELILNGSGILEMPNNHIGSLTCVWTLLASPEHDYVFIETNRSQYSVKVCYIYDEGRPAIMLRPWQRLTLTLGHRASVICEGDVAYFDDFRITFSTVSAPGCEGAINGSGVIQTPNHPNHYSDFASCTWNIEALPVEGFMLLQFTNFTTEMGYDFLNIFVGESLRYRLSGWRSPAYITLQRSSTITFTSDHSATYPGLSIFVKTIAVAPLPENLDNLTPHCHYISVNVSRWKLEHNFTSAYFNIRIKELSENVIDGVTRIVTDDFFFPTLPGRFYEVHICPVYALTIGKYEAPCAVVKTYSGSRQVVAALLGACVKFYVKETHQTCSAVKEFNVTCMAEDGTLLYSTDSTICDYLPERYYNCTAEVRTLDSHRETLVTSFKFPKGDTFRSINGEEFPCICKSGDICRSPDGLCSIACSAKSWGPGCQVGELSTHAVNVEQYATSDDVKSGPYFAMDGDNNTCSRTPRFLRNESWWSVALVNSGMYSILEIRVLPGNDRKNLRILMTNQSEVDANPYTWVSCQNTYWIDKVLFCKTRVIASRIAIFGDDLFESGLSLCEISITGYIHKECNSSEYYGPGCMVRRDQANCDESDGVKGDGINDNLCNSFQCSGVPAGIDVDGVPKLSYGAACTYSSIRIERWKTKPSQMLAPLRQFNTGLQLEYLYYSDEESEYFERTEIAAYRQPNQATVKQATCSLVASEQSHVCK